MAVISLPSAIPGVAVPGAAEPALVQQSGSGGGTFYYYGHLTLDYLDYLDSGTGHTLVVSPGNFYSMAVVNSRRGLTVPPPDGRWNPGTVRDMLVFHPHSAAWDRDVHFRRPPAVSPAASLGEARAAIGPGAVPSPLVPPQQEGVGETAHPAGSAAWDREAHFRVPPAITPQPSLAEARAAIGSGPEPEPVVTVQPGETPGTPPLSLAEVRARIGR